MNLVLEEGTTTSPASGQAFRRSADTPAAHVSYIHVVDPVIEAYKKDVDIGLLTDALKMTPEERLRELIRLHEFGEKLRRAYAARRPRSGD